MQVFGQNLEFPSMGKEKRHHGGRGLCTDAVGKEEDGEVSLEVGPAPGSPREADVSLGAVTPHSTVALPTKYSPGSPLLLRGVGRGCVPRPVCCCLLLQPSLHRSAHPVFITMPVYFSKPNIL